MALLRVSTKRTQIPFTGSLLVWTGSNPLSHGALGHSSGVPPLHTPAIEFRFPRSQTKLRYIHVNISSNFCQGCASYLSRVPEVYTYWRSVSSETCRADYCRPFVLGLTHAGHFRRQACQCVGMTPGACNRSGSKYPPELCRDKAASPSSQGCSQCIVRTVYYAFFFSMKLRTRTILYDTKQFLF